MFAAQRRRLIMDRVRAEGWVTLQELVAALDASPVTVRRDLDALQAEGLLVRRRGGAALPDAERVPSREGPVAPPDEPAPEAAPPSREEAAPSARAEAASAIAELAATLVEDGDALLLGAGTATRLLARRLAARRDLTVVTNSLLVAEALATSAGAGTAGSSTGTGVVMTGGALHGPTYALVGSAAEQSIAGLRARRAFLCGDGLTTGWGLSTATMPAAGVDRAMAQAAQEVLVLADHTVLGRDSLFQTVPTEGIAHLVTDGSADPAVLDGLTRSGVRVHVAHR
jgi:DeoR/GlpR family transcriptional regulator of sugar metabolism